MPQPTADQYHSVLLRLWPFIRVWGLCGAHPDALNAMSDAASLLGISSNESPSHVAQVVADAQDRAVVDACHVLADWFAERFPVPKSYCDEVTRELRAMASAPRSVSKPPPDQVESSLPFGVADDT